MKIHQKKNIGWNGIVGKANNMELKFCAKILQNENMDAAYVEVPYDIKDLF